MLFGGWGSCPGFSAFGYGPFGGGSLIGLAFQGILLIALIAGLVYFFRNLSSRTPIVNNNNALSILQTRYAKGEIDSEEFQRRKQEMLK